MWNLPRSGIEPTSPALAGWLFTTEPPGKLNSLVFYPVIAYRDVVISETPLGCVLITCAYVFNLKKNLSQKPDFKETGKKLFLWMLDLLIVSVEDKS